MPETAYLLLQSGQVFRGKRFGAPGEPVAECVFTTGVVGYLETLTDPSYYGQMVVQTFPLIGNYGVIPEDFESERPRLSAYITRDICDTPSNFRSAGSLEAFLVKEGIPGLRDVDTRALTRILRENGTMNAALLTELPEDVSAFAKRLAALRPAMAVRDVSCDRIHALGDGKTHAAVWDFGHKSAMVRALLQRGCRVTVVPSDTSAEEILALRADGLLLSNGPGDPADNPDIIRNLRKVAENGSLPIFGICLGHQLLALAMGGGSGKLPYGHRGANQPVRDAETGRLYSTSQNHGYAIDKLPPGARPLFLNLNDQTNEGLAYSDLRAFSVQFHPEACAGPQDTSFLFDRFLDMLEVR